MKKILIAILFFGKIGFSQEKIPFIDYSEISSLAQESINAGDFEKTVELLSRIPKNDSTYYSAMKSKSYYLLQLKKYEEVIKIANEGIKNHHNHSKDAYYVNKGVALTNLKRYSEAMDTYDEALKIYPKSYLIWYNKGIVATSMGNLNDAISFYKKSIILNPFYRNPHFQLGNIFYKQERLTQALMCFNVYLLLEPDANNAFDVLKSLNNVVKANNLNKRDLNIELLEADDSYEEIDLILDSKMTLNKSYKLDNEINVALTRQNHALITQLRDFEGNDGFWSEKYLLLYKWIAENNYFDDFTYTLSYSIENENFKKVIQKNKKRVITFLGKFKTKWASLTSKNKILFNGEKQEVTFDYDKNYTNAIGRMENNIQIGYWEYYDEDGMLIAKGDFDKLGKRTGKWTWYTGLNEVKETAFYVDGKLNGKNLMLHKNGNTYVNANYKEGKLEDEYKYYNSNGALIQHKYFKGDTLDGIYKSYFKVGEEILEFNIPYKNGLIYGEATEYYSNGQIYSKTNYSGGKITGVQTQYYIDGGISSEINYNNGVYEGSYKTYHKNGEVSQLGQCKEGAYDGSWKQYYPNGILQSEFSYKNDKLTGISKNYDTDGKLYYEFNYRKGNIISYRYYDKQGKVIKEGKKKGGEFLYEGMSPLGVKITEGLYDVSGGKKGKWKYFTNNGIQYNEGEYIDNKAEGNHIEFYKNGVKKSITPYKNDIIEGYYTAYHLNGNLKVQGWYKKGEQHGVWKYYYLDGTKQAINFFHKSKLHGNQIYYGVNGKVFSEEKYKYGEVIKEVIYDNNNNVFQTIDYTIKKGKNVITRKHINNEIQESITFVNGVRHGEYKKYDFNGNLIIDGNYLNDKMNGLWTWYDNGKINATINYLNGEIDGDYITYYQDKRIKSKTLYDFGLEVGKSIDYFKNGKEKISTNYYQGKLHGRKKFFDPTGKLQLVRFYEYGRLIGYSYEDKNGDELPMIPLKNETGKIISYYNNGKIAKELEYKNGDLINMYKSYFYNGNQEDEIHFVDGEYEGVKKEFFENGKLMEESEYSYGVLHGKKKEYFENGIIKSEESYINGQLNGICLYYNEKGKLKKKKNYCNDKIWSEEVF